MGLLCSKEDALGVSSNPPLTSLGGRDSHDGGGDVKARNSGAENPPKGSSLKELANETLVLDPLELPTKHKIAEEKQRGPDPELKKVNSSKKGQQKEASSKDPFIRAVNAACTFKPASGGLKKLLASLKEVVKSSPKYFQPGSTSLIASQLSACVTSVTKGMDTLLQPIVQGAERILGGSEAGGSAQSTNWDAVRFEQLLEALEGACRAEYGGSLSATVSEPLFLMSKLVLGFWELSTKESMQVEMSVFQVPSLCSIASMLGVIFYRKVVLESGAALQAKADQMSSLIVALMGGDPNAPHHVAACLDAPACAMLMAIQQGAATGGERKASLVVTRSRAFWDTLNQAAKQDLPPPPPPEGTAPHCYKVYPSFVDEMVSKKGGKKPVLEAGEGHGPRKEFFLHIGEGLSGQALEGQQQEQQQQARSSLFTYNRSAGAYWYNSSLNCTATMESAYRLAGWLAGQSLLCRAPLGIPLPPVLFKAVLEGETFSPNLSILRKFDPDAAASIAQVSALPASQLRDMMEMEDLPKDTTAAQYEVHATKQILVEAVKWQSQAFQAGFFSAVDRKLLEVWCLGPMELAEATAGGCGPTGSADLPDFQKLFRVVMDEDLSKGVLGDMLWSLLASWDVKRRRAFLQFVTGSARPPIPGSELLKVEAPFVAFGLEQHKAQLGMLPQAHTCDNLLELPDYWNALLQTNGFRKTSDVPPEQLSKLNSQCRSILDDRLTMAVTMGLQGYGLDEREGDECDEFDWGEGEDYGGDGCFAALSAPLDAGGSAAASHGMKQGRTDDVVDEVRSLLSKPMASLRNSRAALPPLPPGSGDAAKLARSTEGNEVDDVLKLFDEIPSLNASSSAGHNKLSATPMVRVPSSNGRQNREERRSRDGSMPSDGGGGGGRVPPHMDLSRSFELDLPLNSFQASKLPCQVDTPKLDLSSTPPWGRNAGTCSAPACKTSEIPDLAQQIISHSGAFCDVDEMLAEIN